MAGEPIGSARVDFTGDNEHLKAKAAEAVQVVQQTAAKVEAVQAAAVAAVVASPVAAAHDPLEQKLHAADRLRDEQRLADALRYSTAETKKLDTAVDAAGETFKRQSGKVRGFFAGFFGVAALIGSMYALGAAIRNVFDSITVSGTKKAEDFIASLDVKGSAAAVADLDKQIQQLQATLAANKESAVSEVYNALRGDFNSSIRDQLTRLNEERVSLAKIARGKENADKEKAEKEEAAKRAAIEEQERIRRIEARNREIASALDARLRAQREADQAGLEGIALLKAQRKADLEDATARQKATDNPSLIYIIEEQKAAIKEKYRKIIAKAEEDEKKKRIADAEEVAKKARELTEQQIRDAARIARAQTDAIDQVRSAAASMFPADNTAIVEGLADISNLLGAIAAQRGNTFSGT